MAVAPKTTFGVKRGASIEVVIDGSHVYNVTSKGLQFAIDYELLRNILTEEYDCRRIHYIMKVAYDRSGEIQQPSIAVLLDWLRFNGFNTILGEAREWVDTNSGRRGFRHNADVAVTCALLGAASRVNDIILFAGSEDLSTAVEECMSKGPRVTVVSTKEGCSMELRSSCDWFVDIGSIKDRIQRPYNVFRPGNPDRANAPDETAVVTDRGGDSTLGARARVYPRS